MREKLDATLLNSFPGYAFIKGFAENLRQTEELAGSFLPVVVQFDDHGQIAFETYREPASVEGWCSLAKRGDRDFLPRGEPRSGGAGRWALSLLQPLYDPNPC